MNEAAAADRILMMRAGYIVNSGSPRKVFNEELELAPICRTITTRINKAQPRSPQDLYDRRRNGAVVMEVTFENVSADYQLAFIRSPLVLQSIDLTIASGSFSAVVGYTGSGKSSLLKAMNGLLLPKGRPN